MSVNTSVNQQRAASHPPALDDILRIYTIDRLWMNQDDSMQYLPELSFLTDILHTGISLSLDDQIICNRGLNALRETISSSGSSDILHLSFIFGSKFCNGQAHWAKILNMLDSVVYMIASNFRNVFLVDQLCHYCENIHISSDGQTLSEWIFEAGKRVEMIQDQNPNSSISVFYNSPKVEETSVSWVARCPCGADPDWSISDRKKCNKCQKYPCALDGCKARVSAFKSLEQHLKKCHTPEEHSLYKDHLLRFKLECCRCGEKFSREKGLTYVECPKCGAFKCLRGDCTSVLSNLEYLLHHHRKYCKFPQESQYVCGSCGAAKARHRSSIQRCPEANCKTFWCPYCGFEGKNKRSISSHMVRRHRD